MIQLVSLLAGPPLLWSLWRLAQIDIAEHRLPDRLTLPLIAIGIGLGMLGGTDTLWPSLWGAALGFAVPALIGEVFWRWRGVEGLGLGDAKLISAAGAWLGLSTLPWLVLMASAGALVAAAAGRSKPSKAIAFGPWLAGSFAFLYLMNLAGMALSHPALP